MKFILCSLLILATTQIAFCQNTDSIAPRPHIGEIASGAAIGLATNGIITELFKRNISEIRPDGSDDNSFPSRHTSWAFTASTLLSNNLYRYSPWYGLGAQALASAIGAQRIVTRHHYASDVVFGAFIGIGSAELGTFVARKILGHKSVFFFGESVCNDFRTSVAMETGAMFWGAYSDNYYTSLCTGYSTAIRIRVPLSACWGVAASLRGSFTPADTPDGIYPISTAGITAGCAAHFGLGDTALAIEPTIEAGGSRLFCSNNKNHVRWGWNVLTDFGISWQITQAFAFRGVAGFHIMSCPDPAASFTLGVSSVAVF